MIHIFDRLPKDGDHLVVKYVNELDSREKTSGRVFKKKKKAKICEATVLIP